MDHSECGRVISGTPKGAIVNRIFLTSGTGEKLTGVCMYFIRTRMDINITIKNAADVSQIAKQNQPVFKIKKNPLFLLVCKLFVT